MERDISSFGEVEKVFVAVVDEALGLNRLEVPSGDFLAFPGFDRDRFYPVEGVLQNEARLAFGERKDELVREKGIGRSGSDIQKKGRLIMHQTMQVRRPFLAPFDESRPVRGIIIFAIIDAQIVGGRSYDEVYGTCRHFRHSLKAVTVVKIEHEGSFIRTPSDGKARFWEA